MEAMQLCIISLSVKSFLHIIFTSTKTNYSVENEAQGAGIALVLIGMEEQCLSFNLTAFGLKVFKGQ